MGSFKNIYAGLALALETIIPPDIERIDENRIIPTSKYLDEIDEIIIDVDTIIFELATVEKITDINSLRKETIKTVESLETMPTLIGIVRIINSGRFTNIPDEFRYKPKPNSKVEKQIESYMRVRLTIRDIYPLDTKILIMNRTKLIYSSNNFWLSSSKRVSGSLRVLESHTGIILDEITLNKRFKKSKKYDCREIPYDRTLLLLLGDGKLLGGFKNDELKNDLKMIIEKLSDWNALTPRGTIDAYILHKHPKMFKIIKDIR